MGGYVFVLCLMVNLTEVILMVRKGFCFSLVSMYFEIELSNLEARGYWSKRTFIRSFGFTSFPSHLGVLYGQTVTKSRHFRGQNTTIYENNDGPLD